MLKRQNKTLKAAPKGLKSKLESKQPLSNAKARSNRRHPHHSTSRNFSSSSTTHQSASQPASIAEPPTTSSAQKSPKTNANGSVTLLMGPMFSGKTTQLLNLYRKHQESPKHKVLLVKHSSDIRYNGAQEVVSHTNSREAAIAVQTLADPALAIAVQDKTHVFIDEGQFFPDLDVIADKFANDGKKVYIAALDGTFQREPFGVVSKVISRADSIEKLLSVCHLCGDDAPFSKRFSTETEVCVIGGKDKYKAVCRSCYFEDAV